MKKFFNRFLFRLFIFVPFVTLCHSLCSQQINVSFRVTNIKNETIPFATLTVIKKNDSTQAQTKVADSLGRAVFLLTKNASYIVRLSSASFKPVERKITVTADHLLFSFALDSVSKTLQGVVVTAKEPLMKQEEDKTIVNPEPIAAASTNAYEILEKTPGIFVDQDGNVYLSSMTPATIYINGREMKMSTDDIATMLKNLPPNAVSKIEILRTPSAKYDASATGGIVNIVLKKGVKLGMTGSIIAGMQQGTYGNQFLSFNLNNNDGKKSSYINLNYSKRNSFDQIITHHFFAPDSLLSENAYTQYPGNSYFAGWGIANSWSRNWEVSYDGGLSYNNFNNNTNNRSEIEQVSSSDTLVNSLNQVNNHGFTVNGRSGLELVKKFDTTGSQLDNDIFYNYVQNNSTQSYSTNYFTPFVYFTSGDGTGNNRRNYVNARSDLKLKMKRRFVFEAGAKASWLDFKNIANYFDENAGVRAKDNSRTNTFDYRENINALYVQGSKTLGKDFIIKIGTRMENTNMDGHQTIPSDTSFTIHRTDFFPYIFLSKKVMSIAGYELRSYLVFRRTITRPGYDQLNPFPRYVDQYLSDIGNPALRPQFTTNYEANISVDERPLLAIGYNNTKDIFSNVIYQADSSNRVDYRTYDNLGSNKEIYLRGLGAIPPGKKYFFVLGVQYNHNFYQGSYENEPLSYKRGTWTLFTYHQLKLDKRSQLTLSGFVRFNGLQQFYELSTFGALNASINRQFLKQKLIITLSMNDIFYTNHNDFSIDQAKVVADGSRKADTRRAGINFRYNFGIKKKEENSDIFNTESPEKTN